MNAQQAGTALGALSLGASLLAACAPSATPPPLIAQATQPAAVESLPLPLPAPTFAPLKIISSAPSGDSAIAPPPRWPVAAPTPDTMIFRDYGVNPFVDTSEDRLSTFAVDVDTASYTLMRNYLNQGLLPPPEAVRVEEFVNYFDQDYAAPPNSAFAVFADGAPALFYRDGSTHLIRIGLQGRQVNDWARQPAALTFVIDVSGSMNRENRLGLVKQSLQLLVDNLRPSDTVAIVVYGSEARLVLPPTSAEDRTAILSAIYALRPEGSTNAEAGLLLGYDVALRGFLPGGINRIILCSDGVANVGNTGPEAILAQVRDYARRNIQLTTVGFGMGNFNDVLMEQLANQGNGFYAYVDDLDEARRVFVEDLTSTLQVIALDAKVQVDFNPDTVSYYRLLGYENRALADQDFRNDEVDAGEIGAGHTVTALYALVLHPGAQGRLATVSVRWQDPATRQVNEINGNINTWDLADDFRQASARYQLSVLAAHYAEILRASPWAAHLRLADLLPHTRWLAGQLAADPAVTEFAQLVERAAQLSR